MSSTSCHGSSYVGAGCRVANEAEPVSAIRTVVRFGMVALAAMTLVACAQSPVVNNRTASLGVSRPAAAPQQPRRTASLIHRRVMAVARKRALSSKNVAAKDASVGIASFYAHDTQTASGEKFDAREMTAAHRTLPFGTRLRVTNMATGQSITVRVNDRGPYIPGRVVDVTSSAAETLGISKRGIAKVKLDVVD